ncbi:recombinase family protein [Thalassorhabdus alkalitolerans]|uniref:Recombinase family protein n=1 Tax=Thalassorhabdus alkalitolerans TaxID=2282697 RepID=A0ABW0YJX6_9BACI
MGSRVVPIDLFQNRDEKMTTFGYARVSSQDQNLHTQLEQLHDFGVDEIVSEKITGVSKKKEKLDTLIDRLQEEDILVVTRMDRLGRSTVQLLNLVEYLQEKNVHLVIMDMGIDTITPTGKFFLTVMSGFSELERSILKEKQRKGIELAKKEGKYRGRVKKYHDSHKGMNYAIKLYKEGNHTVSEICEITNVSRSSLYRNL